MSQVQQQQTPAQLQRSFLESPAVKTRIEELIGKRASQFIASVLQVVQSNSLLQNADPKTIYTAAMTAAVLDLPINNSIGHAWIVPYKGQAQFQLGYKGLIQLAQRTGQYSRINAVPVYANQFKSWNALTEELNADMSLVPEGAIVGYAAYFRLINGFEKQAYMTIEQVKAHAQRFSKSMNNGPWKSDFDAMACKTILKLTLSKFGPLSIDMLIAVKADQAVVKDVSNETIDVTYVDEPSNVDPEEERIEKMLSDCRSKDEVYMLADSLSEADQEKYKELISSACEKFV